MSTLIVTTRTGVRPLGVRGEPLHNAAGQLRRVVRRRLGDDAAGLLADPQVHDDGTAIDWYADWPGEVQPVTALDPEARKLALADVDRGLAAIDSLGTALSASQDTDNAGLIGRSLKLAARRPAESFVFLVGGKPVVVCWGYEKEAASGLLLPSLPRVPAPAPVQHVPVLAPPIASAATIPWLRTLAAALPLLLLLLGAAWLLRSLLPADPALALATREGVAAPTAPTPAPRDPLPVLKASLTSEQSRAKALHIEIAAIEAELKKRVADCRPVEAPKPKEAPPPPKTASAAPPPPPPRPQPQPKRPSDGRLRLPNAPTNNMSFLEGCWRTDPFRHERDQPQPGVSSYCFDASGRGQLEWRRGRTACRTRAQAQFNGPNLALRDADTTCNDGSHWYADQLVCTRGADDVANCSGNSRGAFGPVSWTVNLHKLN